MSDPLHEGLRPPATTPQGPVEPSPVPASSRPLVEETERPGDIAKPFLDHLEELRMVILKSVTILSVAMFFSFVYRRQILEIFYWPLRSIGEDPSKFLKVMGVADPFTLAMQIALFAGIVFALPFILWFLAGFILPALTRAERKMIFPVLAAGVILFLGGIGFCYFLVLPPSLKFFLDFSTDMGFASEWTIQNYISFCTQMLLSFGIAFELPIVVLALAKMGIVDFALLNGYRRHAVVIIVFVAAVVTPTSDVFTLLLMSGPMWALYELCVLICYFLEKKERAEEKRRGY